MNCYFDTSVLVAAAVKGHVHHSRAISALDDLVTRKHGGFMSAHSLAETYSVLTRAPFLPPVYPSEAWIIIEQNFLSHLDIVPLSAKDYREVIKSCSTRGLTGGPVYDALHLFCAQKMACERIYTFNVRDFRALAEGDWEDKICAP